MVSDRLLKSLLQQIKKKHRQSVQWRREMMLVVVTTADLNFGTISDDHGAANGS